MIRPLLNIARNTFTEAIRQPVFVILLLLAGALLTLTPALAAYTLEPEGRGDNKMLIDLSLGTLLIAGVLLASFTATGVIAEEIEKKTVLTVVSKPVSRPVFVLGKFLGVFAAIATAYGILSIVFILTMRHGVLQTAAQHFDQPVLTFGVLAALGSVALAAWGNFYLNWVFTSTLVRGLAVSGVVALVLVLLISPQWSLQSPATEFTKHGGELVQVLMGMVLILQAVMIITAVAVAASTRLGQVMTLVVCVGVGMLGLISGWATRAADAAVGIQTRAGFFQGFGQVMDAESGVGLKALAMVVRLLSVMTPNVHFLWPADAITQNNPFDLLYLGSVSLYAVLYTAVVLGVAVTLFQTREVG